MAEISRGTIVRLVFFVLSWLNAAAANAGWYHLPNISEEGVSIVIAFIVSVWTYWKNNSFTKAAIIGDQRKEVIKKNNKK